MISASLEDDANFGLIDTSNMVRDISQKLEKVFDNLNTITKLLKNNWDHFKEGHIGCLML